jgi:peptidoglycan hydrolase CwlO-like protein
MDEKTIQAVVVSNMLLVVVFIGQKLIEYLFSSLQKKNEKQEHTIDELIEKVSDLQADISALKAQVEISLQYIFKIQKVEHDVNVLTEKLSKVP